MAGDVGGQDRGEAADGGHAEAASFLCEFPGRISRSVSDKLAFVRTEAFPRCCKSTNCGSGGGCRAPVSYRARLCRESEGRSADTIVEVGAELGPYAAMMTPVIRERAELPQAAQ